MCVLIPNIDENYKKSNAPFDVKKIGAELIVNPVVVEAELEVSNFVNVDVARATFTIVFKLILFKRIYILTFRILVLCYTYFIRIT